MGKPHINHKEYEINIQELNENPRLKNPKTPCLVSGCFAPKNIKISFLFFHRLREYTSLSEESNMGMNLYRTFPAGISVSLKSLLHFRSTTLIVANSPDNVTPSS